jgi:general secretion pathway protein D
MKQYFFSLNSIISIFAITLLFLFCPNVIAKSKPPLQKQATISAPVAYFDKKIEQIEFRDISVGDALRILSEESNINIIASQKAAEMWVTMFLRKVTALEVIDALSKTYNLWYQYDKQSNIIRVYTVKEYRSEEVEFKKEETEIFTMKNAKNALDLAETIQNLFYERVYISYGQNQQQLIEDLQQRFARFDLVDRRTKQQFTVGGRGGSSGGGSGNNQSNQQNATQGGAGNQQAQSSTQQSGRSNNAQGNGSAVGRDQSNTKIEGDVVINDNSNSINSGNDNNNNVDSSHQSEQYKNLEFLDERKIRQAPIFVGVIKHQNRVLVRTRDIDAMNEIKKINKQLDVESSMILMEVKVLSVDLSDGYNSLFDFKLKSGNADVAQSGKSISDAVSGTLKALSSSFNPALLATAVSDSFEARLQLLEKENRVTEVATPMLLTSNQEVSRFLVGETVPILINYTAGSISQSTGINGNSVVLPPAPVYEQRSIGNTLLLTPNINADGTVNIQVLIEQSSVKENGATIIVPPTSGSQTEAQSRKIDTVEEKTFSGSVIAADGKAVAVGGLIQEAAANSEDKVPVLGDIPGLGFFFGDIGKNRKRTELVMIIKPHIIKSPAEAEVISKDVLKKNSVHPNAQQADNMDIYSNRDKTLKGYVLEKPYKEYDAQDNFDKYRERGDSREFVNRGGEPNESEYPSNWQPRSKQQPRSGVDSQAQQVYMQLTKYAAKSVRLTPDKWEKVPTIQVNPLQAKQEVNLFANRDVHTIPVASWRQGGINVTAFEVRNISSQRLQIDHRRIRGQWLASTIEESTLAPHKELGDSTYLYLISAMSFEEALGL